VSRLYRKIGGWLGLLAILMATLAPTISHTLVAYGVGDTMAGEHCDMPSMAGMASMGPMDSMDSMHDDAANAAPSPSTTSTTSTASASPTAATPADKSSTTSSHHASLPDGDACGYCSLLAHMPAVPSVEAPFVVTVRAFQHTVATRFESVRRVEPLTFAQPRAPPFIV
jgi:hypothetical protein